MFSGWREFKNRRQVGGLAGLTGTPRKSGDTSREKGISKAGNRYLRGLIVELAWAWLRYQPRGKLALEPALWQRKHSGSTGEDCSAGRAVVD